MRLQLDNDQVVAAVRDALEGWATYIEWVSTTEESVFLKGYGGEDQANPVNLALKVDIEPTEYDEESGEATYRIWCHPIGQNDWRWANDIYDYSK